LSAEELLRRVTLIEHELARLKSENQVLRRQSEEQEKSFRSKIIDTELLVQRLKNELNEKDRMLTQIIESKSWRLIRFGYDTVFYLPNRARKSYYFLRDSLKAASKSISSLSRTATNLTGGERKAFEYLLKKLEIDIPLKKLLPPP
jgi:hypothetical protein